MSNNLLKKSEMLKESSKEMVPIKQLENKIIQASDGITTLVESKKDSKLVVSIGTVEEIKSTIGMELLDG